jgi:putative membrane protein
MSKFGLCCAALIGLVVVGSRIRADEKQFVAKAEDFLARASEWNSVEKELAQYASKNATAQEVKDLGTRLAASHTGMEKDFLKAAKDLKIAIPNAPNKEERDQIAAIEKLKGNDFDRKFVAFVIESHEKALKRVEDQGKASKEEGLKTCCDIMGKVLRQHLDDARGVQKKLGF